MAAAAISNTDASKTEPLWPSEGRNDVSTLMASGLAAKQELTGRLERRPSRSPALRGVGSVDSYPVSSVSPTFRVTWNS